MYVYLVEVETGSTYEGEAMLFDSIWSSRELAEKYCEKFKSMGYLDTPWPYDITEIKVDVGG